MVSRWIQDGGGWRGALRGGRRSGYGSHEGGPPNVVDSRLPWESAATARLGATRAQGQDPDANGPCASK